MGSINLKHTGSGSAIALSSDGTNLLLDGTAIGGGGGSPDLFDENYTTGTKPSATGANAIATGINATATGEYAFGHSWGANASGQYSIAFGLFSTASGISSVAMGRNSVATGHNSFGGPYSRSNGDHCTAFSIGTNSTSYGAGGQYSVAIGRQSKTTTNTSENIAIGKNAISNVTGGVSIAGAGYPVLISNVYSLPTADGSANEVLTTDGSGAVSWAAAGGGGDYVHISTTDITSSTASVEVTLPTGYDRFEFIFDLYSAGQAHVYFQTSQDAGSNWLVNNYTIGSQNNTYSSSLTWTSATYSGVVMTDRAKYLAGSIKIHRASETSATRFVSHASGFDGAGLSASLQNASGMSTAQTARINKVKFVATGSYTYSSGKISLYGIKDS